MMTPHIFDFGQWWRTRGVIHVRVPEFVEICGWLQHDKGRTLSEFFSSLEVMRISEIPESLFQSAPLTSQQPGNRWGGVDGERCCVKGVCMRRVNACAESDWKLSECEGQRLFLYQRV